MFRISDHGPGKARFSDTIIGLLLPLLDLVEEFH